METKYENMEYSQRQIELNTQFTMGKNVILSNSKTEVRFYTFESKGIKMSENKSILHSSDEKLRENISFQYPVFTNTRVPKKNKAILLLHGLNERNWNKYLTWAEYLCTNTQRPVILFPIAFHMNRSPIEWSNPRSLQTVINDRRNTNGTDRTLSFANVILSQRISEKPLRFYSSGRLSYFDIAQLTQDINEGRHPLFRKNTELDIFAYSIGAFLSQITLMENPGGIFDNSKLFLFCGGGVFSSMVGESRCIMDKTAYAKLQDYYINTFHTDTNQTLVKDSIYESFNQMISADRDKQKRELFFSSLKNKLSGIALTNDKVMPYDGMAQAMGKETAASTIEQLNFAFDYCHENPFPIGPTIDSVEVNKSFNNVFNCAANFFNKI